jgi:hypothetical protein
MQLPPVLFNVKLTVLTRIEMRYNNKPETRKGVPFTKVKLLDKIGKICYLKETLLIL